MVVTYISTILKLCSLGLIIAAAGLWAGAGVDARPKYRDEQTLVGGTIWSQLIIPMGLLLSKMVQEQLHSWIHAYFLMTGVGLCWTTGIMLILEEIKVMKSRLRSLENHLNIKIRKYDRVYLIISILSMLAGALTLIQLVILIVL